MTIEIIKCSYPNAWYKDRIGEKHKVMDKGGELGGQYGVAIDSLHKFWYIPFEDAKEINSKDNGIIELSNVTVQLTKRKWWHLFKIGWHKHENLWGEKYWIRYNW